MSGSTKLILTVVVALLVAFPLYSGGFAAPNVVWVCPDGDDDGEGTEGDPFATVRKGISEVDEGGTVHIKPGVYEDEGTGELAIDKSLTLAGADMKEVTIDRSDADGAYGLLVAAGAEDVTLEGFTLIGPDSGDYAYGLKIEEAEDIYIEDVVVQGSARTGLDLNTVRNASIKGVEVLGNFAAGVAVRDSEEIEIDDLLTSDNAWAGLIFYAPDDESVHDVSITNSDFINESVGISLEHSGYTDIVIEDNEFIDNGIQVIHEDADALALDDVLGANSFDRAVVVRGSDIVLPVIFSSIQYAVDTAESGETVEVHPGTYTEDVLIETDSLTVCSVDPTGSGENAIVHAETTDEAGRGVFTIRADDVTIDGFTVQKGRNGIAVEGDGNVIAHNTVPEQKRFNGIVIRDGKDNVIEYNEVQDNPLRGIFLRGDSSETVVRHNTIMQNGDGASDSGGVVIEEESTDNEIFLNCIVDNNPYGVSSQEEVDAQHNWWGHTDGTSEGDDVTGEVLFDPWLASLSYEGDTEFEGVPIELLAELVDSEGDGVEDVTVYFFFVDGEDRELLGSADTDGDGYAELSLDTHLSGDYQLLLKAVGCMEATADLEFDYEDYTLKIDKEGDGTVEMDGEDVALPYEEIFAEGTEVTLKATADSGWEFEKWMVNGDESDEFDSRTITLEMDRDLKAVAHFSEMDVPDMDVVVDVRPATINVHSRGAFMVSIESEDRSRIPGSDFSVTLRNGDLELEALRVQHAAYRLISHFDRVALVEALDGDAGEYELEVEVGIDGDVLYGVAQVHLVAPGPPGAEVRSRGVPPGLAR